MSAKRKVPLKAYEDVGFLKTDHCRAIRLQLEYLKPETRMQEQNVRSTIVVFGSARLPSPEDTQAQLDEARRNLAETPDSAEARRAVAHAQYMVEQSEYYRKTREFARLVSRSSQQNHFCEFVIVTGGGGGIMEAGNRGAADVGAKSIGLNITLPFEQEPNAYITEELCFQFHYFSIRKMHFLLRARALCAFPGGFGTMDEVFETLTLIQTGKIQAIPVVLFGEEFWREVVNWDVFVRRGLISPEDMDIVKFCDTPEEAWTYIQRFWDRPGNLTE